MGFQSRLIGVVALSTSVCGYNNGVGRLPALGWNTWDYCDEKEVREVAEAIVSSGLKDLGFGYINLDDCWGWHRAANGDYQADPNRFPSGMKALADYLHGLGFKFGVYTDSGTYTCQSGGRDFKIPGSEGHYAQDARVFAGWGVDYVKMDFCDAQNLNPASPTGPYANMSHGLNATGRPMWFESCEWGVDKPWEWAAQWTQSWRVTDDHLDNWNSTMIIVEAMVNKSRFGGAFGFNYYDFVYTGGQGCESGEPYLHCPGQTDMEYRTELTMWVLAGSPVIVATDVRNLTSIMKELLFNKEVWAIHQDPLAMPGDQIQRVGAIGSKQVWARKLSDGSQAVAMYNSGNLPHYIEVNLSLVGHDWKNVKVRDIWQQQDMGVFNTTYRAKVEPHGVVFLRMSKA